MNASLPPHSCDEELRKAKGLTPTVPVAELRRRVVRTQQAMERRGFDALFIYGTPSPQPDWVRYLVNFVHPYLFTGSFAVLARQGEPILLIDREWNLPNAREMSWVEDVRWYPYGAFRWQVDEVVRTFARVAADLGLGPRARVGILELEMPALYREALAKAIPGAELVECREVWGDLVRTPTEYDLAMMRRTAAVADAGMRAALEACRDGVPEYEVGLASMRAMAALGAEFLHGGATSTHVNIGSGSTVISNVRPFLFTAKRLARGEMFWLDLSASYAGYYVDFDRTAVIGQPSDGQRRLYDVCREIYEALRAALRPGIMGGDLFRIGQQVAERHGLGKAVNHVYLGHATGITTNERPFLVEGETQPVTEGCLINLEPGIFVPGVGGTSLEDTFLVRADGVESLTQCERALHIGGGDAGDAGTGSIGRERQGVRERAERQGEATTMKKTAIHTPKLHERVENGRIIYSQAIRVEGQKLLFVAGQIARDPSGKLVGKGDMQAQMRQVYANIAAALEAAGATWENVVRTTTYVTSLDAYFKAIDTRWAFMKGDPPTSTTVQVARLAQDAMIEIEAFAIL